MNYNEITNLINATSEAFKERENKGYAVAFYLYKAKEEAARGDLYALDDYNDETGALDEDAAPLTFKEYAAKYFEKYADDGACHNIAKAGLFVEEETMQPIEELDGFSCFQLRALFNASEAAKADSKEAARKIALAFVKKHKITAKTGGRAIQAMKAAPKTKTEAPKPKTEAPKTEAPKTEAEEATKKAVESRAKAAADFNEIMGAIAEKLSPIDSKLVEYAGAAFAAILNGIEYNGALYQTFKDAKAEAARKRLKEEEEARAREIEEQKKKAEEERQELQKIEEADKKRRASSTKKTATKKTATKKTATKKTA